MDARFSGRQGAASTTSSQGIRAGYGSTLAVGRYLGASSPSTARRWVAELMADGLPVYHFGSKPRFRFSDVDGLLAKRGGEL